MARAGWEVRRLAPRAKLRINEFGLECALRVEHDRRYHFPKLLERLKRAGVPLDGVSCKRIWICRGCYASRRAAPVSQEIAGLGLFIVISELDVRNTRTKFDITRPSSGY
jgi:endo-1,4-beta-xylanase